MYNKGINIPPTKPVGFSSTQQLKAPNPVGDAGIDPEEEEDTHFKRKSVYK